MVGSESDAGESENDFDINTVDGPALTHQISGIVGLCITSLLWVITSWRLLYHYSGRCTKCCKRIGIHEEEDNDDINVRADGITTKRILHGLLWTAMVVEAVAYADMVGTNSSNKLNYTLLDIVGRGILEFSTFVIGTVHWFNIISRASLASDKKKFWTITLFPIILTIVTIGVTVASTFEAVVLMNGGYKTVHEFRSTSQVHRITLLVESAGWGIHAVVVAICGSMVHRRISALPTFSQVRSEAKRNIINKMIIPMIFCSISYALRAGWLAADFASRILSPSTTFEMGVGWWVGNCWIPTFIPSIMLLYSIRKRDRESTGSMDVTPDPTAEGSSTNNDATEALLTPSDPFESFQAFRDYEENDDEPLPGK